MVQYPLQIVLTFLEQYKLDKYSAIFQQSGMDGDLLLEADDNVLEELGVISAVERLKIKVHRKVLQLRVHKGDAMQVEVSDVLCMHAYRLNLVQNRILSGAISGMFTDKLCSQHGFLCGGGYNASLLAGHLSRHTLCLTQHCTVTIACMFVMECIM